MSRSASAAEVLAPLLLPSALSALAALACLWLLLRVSHRLGMVDRPGAHKTHSHNVPAVGGFGVLAGLMAAAAVSQGRQVALALVAGLAVLTLVGTIDDRRPLPSAVRFAAQIAAALGMCWFGQVVLREFGELLWPGWRLDTGKLAIAITVFSAVGVINAVNMIDGIDGLAGSLCALTAGVVAVLATASGHATSGPLLAATAAALLVFLGFNARLGRSRALLFLGNGGSLALGLLLAWHLIKLSQAPYPAFQPVTALWLFAVPLIDTVSVMWRRLAAGRSPFAADHQHVHHLLLRGGRSVNAALCWLLAAHAGAITIGLAAERAGVAESWRFYAFLLLALAYHVMATRAARRLPALAPTGERR